MSKTIDERVVQMQFDNKQFEQGAKTTMGTLDKLKEKLQFKDSAKGFQDLDKAAKSVNLSSLSKSIDTIASRFTNMGIIATTALQNITNQAIRAGQQLANSIIVQPISGGFSEYETQLNAVQTILANTQSKGTTISEVNAALDELNKYADQTIYNFTEMTKNIGTFTAAGVDLDTSVQAIKGIANLGAMSGSTSEQVSRAMYQLSQALAAGRVTLQDWNSVLNAGMAGEAFQNALKNTAKAMGIVVDETKTFRESISAQSGDSWLTSDVLLNTLKQFTGDMTDAELATMGFNEEQIKAIQLQADTANKAATQVKTFTQLIDTTKEAVGSGWAQTWEIVFGDFYEARDLWTSVSTVISGAIGNMSNARNNLLQASIGNPWNDITEAVKEAGVEVDDFENAVIDMADKNGIAIDSIITEYGSLGQAFTKGAISSDIVGKTLKDLTESQKESLGLTDDQIQKLSELGEQATDTSTEFGSLIDKLNRPTGRQNIIDGLAEAFRYLTELAKPVSDAFHSVFKAIDPESIYQATVRFRDFFKNLTVSESTANKLRRTFKGLFDVINLIIDGIKTLVRAGLNVLGEAFGFTAGTALDFTAAIGDSLSSFTEWARNIVNVRDLLTKFQNGISKVISVVRNWISAISKIPAVSKAIQTIGKAFTNIGSIAVDAKDKIVELFKGFDLGTASAEEIKEKLSQVWDVLKEAFSGIGTLFTGEGGILSDIGAALDETMKLMSDKFNGIIQIVWGFIDNIKQTFSNIELGNVIAAIFGISVVATMYTLYKVLKQINSTLSKITGPFGAMTSAISSVGTAITKLGKSFQIRALGDMIKNIGIGVALIAASIGVLSLLDQGKLATSAVIVGLLSGVMFGISSLILNVTKNITPAQIGAAAEFVLNMVAIAGAVAILVGAMSGIDTSDLGALAVKFGVVAGLMVVLGAVAAGISKFGAVKADMKTGAASILGMVGVAAAIWLVVQTFKDLSDFNGQAIIDNIGSLITIFSILAGVTFAAKGIKFSNAVGILGMVAAIALLMDAFKGLGEDDLSGVSSNIGALITIFGLFGGLIAVINLTSKTGTGQTSNVWQTALLILSISSSLLLVAEGMKQIGKLSQADIAKSGAVIIAMFAIFAGIVAASKLAGENASKAGVMILAMSASLILIAGAIGILSTMDAGDLAKGTAVVAAIMALYAGITAVSKLSGGEKMAKATTAMSVTIGVMVASVAVLSMIDQNKLAGAVAAMTILMSVFSLAIFASKYASKSIGSLVVITVAIGLIGGLLIAMSVLNVQNAIQNAVAISTLLLAMSAAMVIAGDIPVIGAVNGAAAIGAFAAIIIAIGALIATIAGALGSIEGAQDVLTTGVTTLNLVGQAIGAFIGGIWSQIIGNVMSSISEGLPALGSALSDFAIRLAPFIAIMKTVDLSALAGASRVLLMVGEMLGAEVLALIADFLNGDGSSLAKFGQEMIPFAISVATFGQIIGSSNIEAIEAGAKVMEALSKILFTMSGEGGIMTAIFGEKDLGSFGDQLKGFGDGLYQFAISVQGITPDMAKNADSALGVAEKLIAMSKTLYGEGGVLQYWLGEKDFGSFGKQVAGFGAGLLAFAVSVQAITPDMSTSCENAITISEKLIDLSKKLNASGGVLQWWMGEKDFGKFGSQIAKYGRSLLSFAKSVADITPTMSASCANAIIITDALVDISKKLNYSGGTVLNFFLGEKDFGKFGEQLEAYGESLVEFANSVSDLSDDDVTAIGVAIDATKKLVGLQGSMPKMNGILDYIAGGTYDYDSLGPAIKSLGSGVASFAESITGKDFSNVETAVGAIESVASLDDDMPGMTSLWEAFTGEGNIDLSTFGTYLTNLGNGLGNFYNSIKDADMEQLSAGITQLSTIATTLSGISDLDPDAVANFADSLQSISGLDFSTMAEDFAADAEAVYTQLTTIGNTMMQRLNDAITSKFTMITTLGLNIGLNFVRYVNSGGVHQAPTVVIIIQTMVSYLNSQVSQFITAGQNAGKGYVDGFKEYASKAADAAAEVAQSTSDALNKTLDERSPSRVTAESGRNAVLGFVNELFNGTGMAYSAGEDIANGTIEGLKNALMLASGKFTQDADYEPVIRPVVDLSEVENGAYVANAMLSGNRKFSLYSPSLNIGRAAASMNNLSGNKQGTNSSSDDSSTDQFKSFNFTQNNYSPKALSRSEIYRQTNNQFTRFKKRVTGH